MTLLNKDDIEVLVDLDKKEYCKSMMIIYNNLLSNQDEYINSGLCLILMNSFNFWTKEFYTFK